MNTEGKTYMRGAIQYTYDADRVARDDRGRIDPEQLSEELMLIEVVDTMRAVADALALLSANPMVRAMVPGGLGL